MYGIVPRGCIRLGEALDPIAAAMKVPGWRGWTREVDIFHRWIRVTGDREAGNDALSAAIEDSEQSRKVIVYAIELFYGTPPLHEDAVPTLVIDGKGRSILIPVEEWRHRAGALQRCVRRRWSPCHEDPAFEIFVRRVPLEEALARDFGATDGGLAEGTPDQRALAPASIAGAPKAKSRSRDPGEEAKIRSRIEKVHAAAQRSCTKKRQAIGLKSLAEELKGTGDYSAGSIRKILNGTYGPAKRRGYGPFEWKRPKR